jgi:hypothetical protein
MIRSPLELLRLHQRSESSLHIRWQGLPTLLLLGCYPAPPPRSRVPSC